MVYLRERERERERIFQLYHGEKKIIFNEMMMKPVGTRPTRLVGNSLQVDMSPYSDTLA
jgi:hypothetical protein